MRLAAQQSRTHAVKCSSSSSSSSRFQVAVLLPRPAPSIRRVPYSSCRAAAAAGQPQPPEPEQGQHPEPQQQQAQQQETLHQQNPPAAQAVQSENASLSLTSAAAAAAAVSPDAEDVDPETLKQQRQWADQELQWLRTGRNMYLLMALGLTASGLLVAVGAAPIAAAGLKLGVGLQAQQAAVLVGCFGAAVIRAASLAWFLAEGAALGELGSWRYQRVNLGLGAAAAAAALAAATAGWAGAQPWLLLVLVGSCGATAAVCVAMALKQLQRQGFYFASAIGYGDAFQGFAAAWWYLVYNITCLPGALMAAIAVAGAVLGVAALSGAAAVPLLPWVAPGSSGVAAATLLHKLLGAGLLLLGLQAWTLSEYAANGRDISPETGVKLLFARTGEEYAVAAGELGPSPVHVPLQRFDLLHLGFVAAAVAQGLWLAQAAVAGPGVGLLNAGDPVWGSLFWGVMGTAAYLLILLCRMDYSDVVLAFLRVLNWGGTLVSLGAGVLYVDWMWLAPVERR